MAGRIYPRSKCPVCGARFEKQGEDFICPVHWTRPKRYYIQVYSKQLKKHVNIYKDARGFPFSSYEMAHRTLVKIRVEVDEKKFDIIRYVSEKLRPLLFENWVSKWEANLSARVEKGYPSPSYLKTVQVHIRCYLRPYFKSFDIRDISSKEIESFYMALPKMSLKYARNILMTLHAMLETARRWEDIDSVPVLPEIQLPEVAIQTISVEQQDEIIQAIPDTMTRVFVMFCCRTMVRPSEARSLLWEDLASGRDMVTIQRHFSLDSIRPATKGKQIKHIPIDQELKDALKGLPRHMTSPFVFWHGKEGKPFPEYYARREWQKVAIEKGVNIPFYSATRHSSATEAVNRVGFPLVQEFLHHSNPGMTRRYAKMSTEALKPVLRVDKNKT